MADASASVDKSAVSDDVLPLPKGGGALRGIGETFDADPQGGTYQVRVPIDVPSGRRGLHPELSLDYSSGAGNGPFGLGWSLTVPAITRSTRHGTPTYDERDTFLLGGRDLVPIRSEDDATRFRIDGEDAYAEVVQKASGNKWEVTRRDGRRTIFGGTDSAILCSTGEPRVFGWLPTTTEDLHGNRVVYQYRRDDGHGLDRLPDERRREEAGHEYNQAYLWRVEWVERDDGGWLYSVDLDYGDLDDAGGPARAWSWRPDAFSVYRPGFEMRTARLCQRIFVRLHDGAAARPIRTYLLDHVAAPGNGAMLVHRIQETAPASDSEGPQALPPLEFTYSELPRPRPRMHRPHGDALPAEGLNKGDVAVLDGDGRGLAGIVRMQRGEKPEFLSNRGGLNFEQKDWAAPHELALADPNVWLADFDGDGYADILRLGPNARYYPSIPGAGWSSRAVTYPDQPTLRLTDPDTNLVDVDGDGVVDAISSVPGAFLVHYNRGTNGWHSEPVPRGDDQVLRALRFSDPLGRARLADVSGDGPVDIVWISQTEIMFWPHIGHGVFAARRTLPIPPVDPNDSAHPFGPAFQPRRVLFGDIDGDGFSDVLYVRRDSVTVWRNRSGNALSEPVVVTLNDDAVIDGAVSVGVVDVDEDAVIDDVDAVRVVDALGTGTAGLLWSQRNGTYRFLEFAARMKVASHLPEEGKPYLLRSFDNHRGAVATIEYAPSTEFALADDREGLPWRTRLPFPVHVVSEVTVRDDFSASSMTSTFRYHEGAWDGVCREYRGFGRVDRYDAKALDELADRPPVWSPPVETRLWFHVGALGPAAAPAELDAAAGWARQDPPLVTRPRATETMLESLRRRSPSAWRRVVRTLRGKLLRVETRIAAEDGRDSARERPLFAVEEYAYGLRQILDGRHEHDWLERPAVFLWEHARRTTLWQEGDEPLTRASYRLGLDDCGRSCRRLEIAVPRGRDPRDVGCAYLATFSDLSFARPTSGHHIPDAVAVRVGKQVLETDGLSVAQVADRLESDRAPFDELPTAIINAECTYYDGPPHRGLELGMCDARALPTRVERLVHTGGTLAHALAGRPTPPWLTEATQREHGLSGEYFVGSTPAGDVALRRPDPRIAFAWGRSAPDPVLPPHGYAVRWSGHLTAPGDGALVVDAAGRVRLWLDGELAVDRWEAPLDGPAPPITLAAEQLREIALEFAPGQQPARISLYWTTSDGLHQPVAPASLRPSASNPVEWTEYPDGFQGALAQAARLVYRTFDDGQAPDGYYATVASHQYDIRGLPTTSRDRAGVETALEYGDGRRLLPTSVLRGGRLEQHASYDYRVQRPRSILDANGDTTLYRYGPLGLLSAVAYMGKDAEPDLDTLEHPSIAYHYGLADAAAAGQPVWVRTWRRVEHGSGPDGAVLETIEYSDGFGRPLQTRSRYDGEVVDDLGLTLGCGETVGTVHWAPPEGNRYRVHGWVEYDNKGRVATTYEPFFDTGPRYQPPADKELERTLHRTTTERDALGRPLRVIAADGSQRRFVYGRPVASDPSRCRPGPWEHWDYDGNDEARHTHPESSWATWRHHLDTPQNVEVDALGRTVAVTERDSNRQATARIRYDAAGNVVEVLDPLGRVSFRAAYDLLGRPWRQQRLDTGVVTSVRGGGDAVVEERDARGALVLALHDELDRPARLWARDAQNTTLRLRHAVVYGDDASAPSDAAARRLRGRAWREWDEAGLATFDRYDLHGRVTANVRRYLRASLFAAALTSEAGLPWPPVDLAGDEGSLDGHSLAVESSYDALGRLASVTLPLGDDGRRAILRQRHGSLDELQAVELDGHVLIDRAAYDARGYRILLAARGGIETRFLRDPATSRLLRLHSQAPGEDAQLQDLAYGHDLVGNVLSIEGQDGRRAVYRYDARYRLVSATGVAAPNSRAAPVPYRESYVYDDVGNLERLERIIEGTSEPRSRRFETPPAGNLVSVVCASALSDTPLEWDAAGGLAREGGGRDYAWDSNRRLSSISADGVVAARYFHDTKGQRTAAVERTADGASRVVLTPNGLCERRLRLQPGGATTWVEDILVVRDGDWPLGWLRRTASGGNEFVLLLADHLGSVEVAVAMPGGVVARQAFTPYGELAFRTTTGTAAEPLERLGILGKPQDAATGLVNLGARLYAPSLGRFVTAEALVDARRLTARVLTKTGSVTDPPNPGLPAWAITPYAYALGSPATNVDAAGHQAQAPPTETPTDNERLKEAAWEAAKLSLEWVGTGAGLIASGGIGKLNAGKGIPDLVERTKEFLDKYAPPKAPGTGEAGTKPDGAPLPPAPPDRPSNAGDKPTDDGYTINADGSVTIQWNDPNTGEPSEVTLGPASTRPESPDQAPPPDQPPKPPPDEQPRP